MPSKLVRGCILPGLSWPIGRVIGVRLAAARAGSPPSADAAGAETVGAEDDAVGTAAGGAGAVGVTAEATSSSPRRADRPRPRPRGFGGWLMGQSPVLLRGAGGG